MNNAPFKIGQKVVCVKTYNFDDLKIGEPYVISAIKKCCDEWVVAICLGRETFCSICRRSLIGRFRRYTCFAPIEEQRNKTEYYAVTKKPVEVDQSIREMAVETAAIETN